MTLSLKLFYFDVESVIIITLSIPIVISLLSQRGCDRFLGRKLVLKQDRTNGTPFFCWRDTNKKYSIYSG